jgi:hypothetical protein
VSDTSTRDLAKSSHRSDLQNEEEAVEKPDWKEKPIFVRNV